MNIIIVDSEKATTEKHKATIEKLYPLCGIDTFTDSLSALASAREKEYDVAFLNGDMPELGGIDLGTYIKELHPFINLIYVCQNKDYAYDALKIHASGYILKPLSEKDIKKEFEELRFSQRQKQQKRVFAQTFGNFEFFIDGKPVQFKYNRTKEMVAILINNRGAQVTNGEIIACLWEDDGDPDKKMSYLRNLRQDLQNTLKAQKLENIVSKQRGSIAIVTSAIECDLFDWLEKKKESKYDYIGDYMNQYSWPEFFHAELDEISYSLYDD
ncbi:MAG: response regulator [Firmicutes bacterium]|nr:response regulator [Bacillota bacterium]